MHGSPTFEYAYKYSNAQAKSTCVIVPMTKKMQKKKKFYRDYSGSWVTFSRGKE